MSAFLVNKRRQISPMLKILRTVQNSLFIVRPIVLFQTTRTDSGSLYTSALRVLVPSSKAETRRKYKHSLSLVKILTVISVEVSLDASSVWMRSMSSTGLPSEVLSLYRILSSISFSSAFIWALLTISWFFSSSRSGRSWATAIPSSWSCSPL